MGRIPFRAANALQVFNQLLYGMGYHWDAVIVFYKKSSKYTRFSVTQYFYHVIVLFPHTAILVRLLKSGTDLRICMNSDQQVLSTTEEDQFGKFDHSKD